MCRGGRAVPNSRAPMRAAMTEAGVNVCVAFLCTESLATALAAVVG